MAETVNTGAILISDGHGGYSKLFTESMTDIVKLQNGSSLTEKLAEIDGKLPIVLTSGQLPETLKSGRLLVNDNNFYCGSESNLPCQLARLDQVPEQYVHPVTKVCNYIYTHPTEKQCNYTPDLSNVNSSKLQGYTYQQIVDAAVSKSASLTTLYDKIVSINVSRSMSNTEIMLTQESDLPQDFVVAFKAKAVNSIFTVVSYSDLNLTFTMHREWNSNGSIGLAVRADSYNYGYISVATIGNGSIQQDVPYSGSMQGLIYAKPIFHSTISKEASESVGLYSPGLYCSVSQNSADKYFSISGTFRCKIQSLQFKL